MRAVFFLDEAEAEVREAQAGCEARSPGLGQAFVTRVQAAVARIRRSPRPFPTVDADLRRARTRRFPYGIFYLVESDRIVVVAVFHGSRNPQGWMDRV